MTRPKLVVLGSGFAGMSLLMNVRSSDFDVTIVSPKNHFLFTPLLTSTTVGTIEFRSIIEPVRAARAGHQYYQARVVAIDTKASELQVESALGEEVFSLPYDELVIAVGAESNTYGIPGVHEHTHFLKELSDARAVRQQIIAHLEQASLPTIAEERRKQLLHFAVVGGGPTGIEFAAELNDFLEEAEAWYPASRGVARITLLEATEEILRGFDASLREYAERQFQREKIEVRKESPVQRVEEGAITLRSGETLLCGLIVWATGLGPRPFVEGLPFARDDQGRLMIDTYLCVEGETHVYSAGDCAAMRGNPFPATAQVAQRQGAYLAKSLTRRLRGKKPKPFRHKNLGMLAYIGGRKALADLPGVKGRGFSAWLFWRSVYVTKLVRLKNKVLVLFDWLKAAVFGRDMSRF